MCVSPLRGLFWTKSAPKFVPGGILRLINSVLFLKLVPGSVLCPVNSALSLNFVPGVVMCLTTIDSVLPLQILPRGCDAPS